MKYFRSKSLFLIVATTILLFDVIIGLGFRYPNFLESSSKFVYLFLRKYHIEVERVSLQFQPSCSQFDSELFYLFRPGDCHFESREFKTTLQINSLGVRGDEASLIKPEWVFLGDSVTMGWGVNDEDTFSSIFAKKTGQKVLNLGVASFATFRELSLLSRVDRSALKKIVIQYHENDAGENQTMIREGFQYQPSKARYEENVKNKGRTSFYFPGKHFFKNILSLFERKKTREAISSTDQADAFFNTLKHFRDLFTPEMELWVLNIQAWPYDSEFIKELEVIFRRNRPLFPFKKILFLKTSDVLNAQDFFKWDDHMNPLGHQKLAQFLISTE